MERDLGAEEASRAQVLGRGRSAEKSLGCSQEDRQGGRSERTEASSLRPPFPPMADTETAGHFFHSVFITRKVLLIKS